MTSSTVFKVTRWSAVSGTLLVGMAMLLYPGGTFRNPSTHGYSFFQNSLSDLGTTVAWGGQRNSLGALCLAFGCGIVALAGVGCLVALVRVYSSSGMTRWFAGAAGTIGVLSCVGFIGAALAPEDLFPTLHSQFSALAVQACPVASLLFALVTARDDRFPRRVAAGWLALALVLVAWASVMYWGRPPTTDEWLTIPVTLQKIATVALLVVFWFQSYEAERVLANVEGDAV